MSTVKYRCKICGYKGKKFIFELNDHSYCLASNTEEPEYIGEPPVWVKNKGVGDAKVESIVGCPKCRAWGEDRFEIIDR